MDEDALNTGAGLAILLSVFFIAGFVSHSVVGASSTTDKQDSGQESVEVVSQAEAIEKARQKLETGPFSYPFTYNISTVSVNNDTRIPGTTFYNWTLSYTVEANPFQSSLYRVPGNQTEVTKTLTLYISQDGDYIFQSPPIATELQGRTATGLP